MSDEKIIAPLKIGDVVRLKSGGPWMTIESEPENEFLVECIWFPKPEARPDTHEFPLETLELRGDAETVDELNAQLDEMARSLSSKHMLNKIMLQEDLEPARERIAELERELELAKREADLTLNNTLMAITAEIRDQKSQYRDPSLPFQKGIQAALDVIAVYRVKESKPCA